MFRTICAYFRGFLVKNRTYCTSFGVFLEEFMIVEDRNIIEKCDKLKEMGLSEMERAEALGCKSILHLRTMIVNERRKRRTKRTDISKKEV